MPDTLHNVTGELLGVCCAACDHRAVLSPAELPILHATPPHGAPGVSHFDLSDTNELKAASVLPNLQPLWGPANMTKGHTLLL